MNKSSAPDQRTSKRRRTCLDNGIRTPPSIPPTSAATHATSQETQYHPPQQSQQSSASRDPSLKHILIHRNPPHSSGYKVSSGGCECTNTTSRDEMAMSNTAHQSSSHLDPVSFSQSNPMQGAHGSILSQRLQYDGEYRTHSRDRPIPEPGNLEGEGYNSVAAVQLFQNAPTTVMDQAVTTTAETFNSHSHAAMGDASMVLNPPSYVHNRIPSIGTQSQEDVFDPTEYYTGGNPTFNTLPQQKLMGNTGFDASSHQRQENPNFGTQSQEDVFDPTEYYTGGNLHQQPNENMGPSSWSHRRQEIPTSDTLDQGQMGTFGTSNYIQ